MYAYILNGAIYCEDCAEVLRKQGAELDGPYPEGGGESDSPTHCDACGVFLENPLTEEGLAYVCELVIEYLATGRGDYETLKEWVDYYFVDIKDLLSFAQRQFGTHPADTNCR